MLAERSDLVARKLDSGDPSGAEHQAGRLQAQMIDAVNAGRIPRRFQEELGAAVASLLASIDPAAPPSVEPARSGTPAARQARNLSDWLRRNASS